MDIPDAHTLKAGPATTFLVRLAGADIDLLRRCPQDRDSICACAELLLATLLFQTAIFSLAGHVLFAPPGQIQPVIVLAALGLGVLILKIDAYIFYRSGWHSAGITELARGGLDIGGGLIANVKSAFFLAVRIALSIGIAQLTAIFVSLLIFANDINDPIRNVYLQANAGLLKEASAPIDAEIKRATEAVTNESTQASALSAQVTALRQNEVDPSDPQVRQAQAELTQLLAQKTKADDDLRSAEKFASDELSGVKGALGNSGRPGSGPRRTAALEQVANARTYAQQTDNALDAARQRLDALRAQAGSSGETMRQQSRDQLPGFEATLAAENEKLASLKDQLARLVARRDDAIRDAVDQAPNHVPMANGLLAQIRQLEHLAESDSKIAAVIILIDVTSFGFELAAVLAKVTSFIPTTYSALLARNQYMGVVRIVDEMAVELHGDAPVSEPESLASFDGPSNDNLGGAAAIFGTPTGDGPDDPPPPPKRPRGRPRKTTLN